MITTENNSFKKKPSLMSSLAVSNVAKRVRVPIPDGVVEGQRMRVIIGPGATRVLETPPKDEWKVDEKGSRYFSHNLTASSKIHQDGALGTFSHLAAFQSWDAFVPSKVCIAPIKTKIVQTFPIAKVKHTGRIKCLLIGINYKGSTRPLKGCVNDVFKMRNLLLRNGIRDDNKHLMMMIDDEFSNQLVESSNVVLPTKKNIIKGLQWLVQGARAGDILLLHYSGHGSQEKDLTGIESDGFNETILPCDHEKEGVILDDIIWSTIVYPLLDGVKLIAIMDSCHSGTVLDLPFNYDLETSRWKEDINPSHSKGDVIQISGCMDKQLSNDVGTTRYNAGGAMTLALLAVLNQHPSPTYDELFRLMTLHLKQQGFKQVPQLTSSQRFNLKDKIFSLTDGIEPNKNEVIGRVVRQKHVEKKSVFRALACSKNR
jgi:hypothetical protein